jgi:hypothetical protein
VAVGLDEMSATFGGGSQATNQIIKMLDDRDVIDPYGGLVYETRSVDAQRGGYWVIYRNPVRQAAPFRVTCVGQLTVGNAEIDAFKNGTASYTYISGATGAVWGDVLSAINVTADWATAVEVSVTRAASLIGYAGLVAGTISTYLDLADQAAAAAGTEGGRAEVNAVFGRAKEGVSPAPGAGAGSAIWQVYTAESQTTSRPVQMNGLGGMKEFETDLTYRLYFTATNVACIGTRGSLVNGVKVDARLRVHYGDNSIHFKWQRQLGSPNNRIYGE